LPPLPLPTLTRQVQIGSRTASDKAPSSREESKKRAENVARAEYEERLKRLDENSDTKARREATSMLGKSDLKLDKKSVYQPVSSFMLDELQGTEFALEATRQKARLFRDYGDRPDDLVERTGDDASSKGSKASDNLTLLAPYITPILQKVCGSSGKYEDCPLSQSVRDQMMDIDHAFLSVALDCRNIKWGSIVSMRQNLFAGILFTRAISPFLLHPDGKPALDEAGRERAPHKVFVKLSAGTNRTFNLHWKDFSRSFVEASSKKLPPDLQKRYDMRVAQDLGKLQRGKKERAYKSMPTSTLPQGEDLRGAMRREQEEHRKDLENRVVPGMDDPEQAAIAAYKKSHPTSFGQRRFEHRFDELVSDWLNSEQAGNEDLNAALRRLFDVAKQEWKERSPESGKTGKASSTSTTSDVRGSGDKGTALASPRSREAERSARNLKMEIDEERNRQLDEFTKHKERKADFRDKKFKAAFEQKMNRWVSRKTGGKYSLALKKKYEDTLIQHYKDQLAQDKLLPGIAWDSSLDQAISAWKAAPENRGQALNGLLMQTFVYELVAEQSLIARFKDHNIDDDDHDAKAKSSLLDTEIAAWKAIRENQGKRLNPSMLGALWNKTNRDQSARPKSRAEADIGGGASSSASGKAINWNESASYRAAPFMQLAENTREFRDAAFKTIFLDALVQHMQRHPETPVSDQAMERMFTSTQIVIFWNQRKGSGWPESVLNEFARLAYLHAIKNKNHIVPAKALLESWQAATKSALPVMVSSFLNDVVPGSALLPALKAELNKRLLADMLQWHADGAHGEVSQALESRHKAGTASLFQQEKQS
jgi:hypothetical protein